MKSPKPDIGQVFVIADRNDDRGVIEFRTVFGAVKDAGRNQAGLKTKRSEQLIEQAVQFITKTAAVCSRRSFRKTYPASRTIGRFQ